MQNDLRLTRFIPADRTTVFKYWTEPRSIEQWSAPKGMTLRVPSFEANKGGKYRYEHTDQKGVWVCNGQFQEFIPNQRLKMIDNVKDPEGKLIFENLEGSVEFRDVKGGTEVSLVQGPFKDEETRASCEKSWMECLDQLSDLVSTQTARERRPEGELGAAHY